MRWGLVVAVSVVVEPPTSNPAATIIDTIVHISASHLSSVLTCVYCTRVPVRSLETNSNLEKLCDHPLLFRGLANLDDDHTTPTVPENLIAPSRVTPRSARGQ